MKTKEEIIKEVGIEWSDLISSSTMGAIQKAMEEYAEAKVNELKQSNVIGELKCFCDNCSKELGTEYFIICQECKETR